MHTLLVNTTEIAVYPETTMTKIMIVSPIGFTHRIYTTLLAHQISLQSEIFALPCFGYLCKHYPREIGENGRAFYQLLACSNPCFFRSWIRGLPLSCPTSTSQAPLGLMPSGTVKCWWKPQVAIPPTVIQH